MRCSCSLCGFVFKAHFSVKNRVFCRRCGSRKVVIKVHPFEVKLIKAGRNP